MILLSMILCEYHEKLLLLQILILYKIPFHFSQTALKMYSLSPLPSDLPRSYNYNRGLVNTPYFMETAIWLCTHEVCLLSELSNASVLSSDHIFSNPQYWYMVFIKSCLPYSYLTLSQPNAHRSTHLSMAATIRGVLLHKCESDQ